ncbi:hypothetical protein [Williamsia sp.]|uniref:hypothetical protein n=1 Tax=Williamsia sp. TaxID=1872085 RepID=UPI002F91FC67
MQTKVPCVRKVWLWLGCAAVVIVLLVAGTIAVSRVFHRDPCGPALSHSSKLGLVLSDDDQVISCEWHSSFLDSSGKIVVRTASQATRDALLARAGVTEELDRSMVSINDGPFQEEVRRPNLERSRQVYIGSALGGDQQLSISYDENVDSGLLLTVWALV